MSTTAGMIVTLESDRSKMGIATPQQTTELEVRNCFNEAAANYFQLLDEETYTISEKYTQYGHPETALPAAFIMLFNHELLLIANLETLERLDHYSGHLFSAVVKKYDEFGGAKPAACYGMRRILPAKIRAYTDRVQLEKMVGLAQADAKEAWREKKCELLANYDQYSPIILRGVSKSESGPKTWEAIAKTQCTNVDLISQQLINWRAHAAPSGFKAKININFEAKGETFTFCCVPFHPYNTPAYLDELFAYFGWIGTTSQTTPLWPVAVEKTILENIKLSVAEFSIEAAKEKINFPALAQFEKDEETFTHACSIPLYQYLKLCLFRQRNLEQKFRLIKADKTIATDDELDAALKQLSQFEPRSEPTAVFTGTMRLR
jgi:hypothetical protein